MYWSTGSQRATASESSARSGRRGHVAYRRKYQDESTNVSIVSVSRRASSPHEGHGVERNAALSPSGDPPRPVTGTSMGSATGSCASGTGTTPQRSQYTIGIGVPQYRWREMPQSRRR